MKTKIEMSGADLTKIVDSRYEDLVAMIVLLQSAMLTAEGRFDEVDAALEERVIAIVRKAQQDRRL